MRAIFREDLPMAETPEIARPYEPPRIERVLTSEDLAQEIMYAGPGVLSVDVHT
jgi:hypothetical protein